MPILFWIRDAHQKFAGSVGADLPLNAVAPSYGGRLLSSLCTRALALSEVRRLLGELLELRSDLRFLSVLTRIGLGQFYPIPFLKKKILYAYRNRRRFWQ